MLIKTEIMGKKKTITKKMITDISIKKKTKMMTVISNISKIILILIKTIIIN